MAVNTDAFIYAGLFSPGDAVTHDLGDGRGAWIQVVHGRLSVAGETFEQGDGVGITNTDQLDITVHDDSEVLLFDVRMDAPRIWQ